MILLPGLYLALLAFLLDRALRRWWDPVPARIWGVFGLVLVILFGPALFLEKVLLPVDILPGVAQPEDARKPPQGNVLQNDLVTQMVPLQAQVRREVRTGAWPLWNDLAGAGMPLLADPQSQVLEPLVLAALPLPLPAAVGVTAGLRVLLALVFLFLLLRRQGLSEEASLFGSLAFGLGGFLLLWLNWPIANSPALLPLVLYALVMTDERGARRDFLLLVAAVFSLLVGGHPETALYVAILGGLFALSRLRRHPAGDRARLLVRWAAAAALAAGLAAPLLVPTFRFVPQSLRHRWVEARNQRLGANPEIGIRESSQGLRQRVVQVFAPNAFGNSRYGEYWGVTNNNEDSSAFVGGAALLAALLAFFPASRRFREERLFLILAPVSLAIAVHLPGVRLLSAKLPVLNQSLGANRRLLMLAAFSLAYLGACTVERWRTDAGPRRWAVLTAAAVLLGLIAWGYLLSADMKELAALRWFWMGTQLAVVAGTAIILCLRSRRTAVLALCALTAAELLIFHRPANPSLPRSAYYPVTPLIRFLQESVDGTRIAGLATRILPNAAAVYGLADVRISDPLKPFAYAQAVGPVSAAVRSTEHVLNVPEHPLYQLLGVRFVVAPPRMNSIPGLKQVFHDPTGRIFERERFLPRLFLPASTETAGAQSWQAWLAANPDFAARALVPPSPGRPAAWTAAREDSSLQILAMKPARVVARARLAEERLLASTIYQDGGWRLLLDGRPFPLGTADGPFLAAWVPAGEHRVELVYRAPGFLGGLGLAAVALAGLTLWMLGPWPSSPGLPPFPTGEEGES
ncbi:MAG TPA: YfhO family protein [Thermoanaerobaculia bacterium]|nr:YfhO family protein [Thermoanaerobaculia bacterium]